MSQVRPEPSDTTNEVVDKSMWHMILRLHEDGRAAVSAREVAERKRDIAKQELAAVEQSERSLIVRFLTMHGVPAESLSDHSLEDLRLLAASK